MLRIVVLWAVLSLPVLAAGQTASPVNRIIKGKVVGEDGAPLAGAEVGLQAWTFEEQSVLPDKDLLVTAATSIDGTFELKIPADFEPSKHLGTLWAISEGHVPGRPGSFGTVSGLLSKPVTVKLQKEKETVVRVLAPDGKPMTGCVIRVSMLKLPQGIGYPIPHRWRESLKAVANDRGEAWISHALPDAIDGLVLSSADSAELRLDQNFFLNVRPAKSGPTFTINLPPQGSIEGRLRVAEGAKLPDPCRIKVMTRAVLNDRYEAWGEATATPDADGTFRIESIAAGRLVIPQFLPESQPLRAQVPLRMDVRPMETTPLTIPVEPGVTVRGQVRKGDTKEGIPDFRLKLIHSQSAADHSTMLDRYQIRTDADGRFAATVPPGPIELRLESGLEGYQSTHWWNSSQSGVWGIAFQVPEGQTAHELPPVELDASKKIVGKLQDRDGKPLHNWIVFGYPEIPGKPQETVMNSFSGVHTDQNGRFQGSAPVTVPPTVWMVSHRDWPGPFEFNDRKWKAEVVSKEPFVLRVDVKVDEVKGSAAKTP